MRLPFFGRGRAEPPTPHYIYMPSSVTVRRPTRPARPAKPLRSPDGGPLIGRNLHVVLMEFARRYPENVKVIHG